MKTLLTTGLLVLFAALVPAGPLVAPAAAGTAANLALVQATADGSWYINERTLVSPAEDRTSFWSTVVPEKNSVFSEMLGMILEKGGKDPGRLAYVQVLQEADCAEGTIGSSTVLFYDKQDRIVHRVSGKDPARLILEYGRARDRLLEAACVPQMARLTAQ